MVYTSQCVSFCEQSVQDWAVGVSSEGGGLEWYVSELLDEMEDVRFRMVRSARAAHRFSLRGSFG